MRKNMKFVIGMTSALAVAGILAGCGSNKYKITFVTNCSSKIAPIEIEWGQVPVLPKDPVNEGHTFLCWCTDPELTNPYQVSSVETDITLYGCWVINTYNVSFVTGVEGLDVPSKSVVYGEKIDISNSISRDYFTFGGWFYDSSFTKEYNPNDVMPGHDVTFYAKWIENNFTITFNANNENATGSMNSFEVKETDASKKLPLNKFKVVGMDFMGWSTTPNGEVEYVDGQDLVHVRDNNNFTLYAVWAVKSINVNFFALNSNDNLEAMKDVPVVKYGEPVQAPASTPSLVGYNFGGWGNMQPTTDSKANFGKVYYSALNDSFIRVSVTENEDISGRNLYEVAKVDLINEVAKDGSRYFALFTRKVSKIHFIESIDGVAGKEIDVKEGYYQATVSFIGLDKPAKAGYIVGGWYHDVECHRMVAGTGVSFAENELTIYLQYVHNAHSLKYSVDGGNSFTTVPRFYEDEIALPEQTKTGYRFLGWSLSPDSEVIYEGKMPDSDLELYAVFEEKVYTVTLHGASAPYTQQYTYNQTLNLGSASKTGYDFGGWYVDSTLENRFDKTSMPDVDNLELYAKFIAHKHQISFDTNGGSLINTIVAVDYDTPLKDLAIPTPTKTGFAFVGWVDKDGYDVNLDVVKMGDADLELTAVYSAQAVNVNVIYKGQDLNGSTYSVIDTATTTAIAESYDFTISESAAKSFTGYVYEKSDVVSQVKADGTSEITVYYTRATLKVTFTAEGKPSEDVNVKYGGKVAAVPTAFAKNGYSQVLKVNGNEINLANYVVNENTTIAIEYVALPQSIQYFGNEGLYKGKVSDYVAYSTDEVVTLPTSADAVREGYTLLGWALTPDGTPMTGTYVMPANSVDLYAIWQANEYTINFVSAQGEAPEAITAAYGSSVTLPSISATGYTFNGYKDANNASIAAGSFIMPLNGADLTAQWTENSVKLVFHGNGATTGAMTDQVINYTGSKAINQNEFVKTGYSFAGWALTASGEAVYADKANIDHEFATTNATIDLYAVWSVNSYTITFDANGGSNVAPITKNYQEEFDAPKAPIRKGYTFVGWFTSKTGGDIVYPEVMGAADITYYAHWEANKYNIIYDANGGTPVASLEKLQGYVLTASDLPYETESEKPTSRTGYVFDGWYENDGTYDVNGNPNDDWGVKITAANIGSFTVDGDDVTFHARWIVKTHTVTYYVNNVTWGDPVSYKYGEAIEKPEDPTLSEGQTFLGWSTSNTEAIYFDFASQGFMGDQDINLYAVVSEDKHTISFVINRQTVYSLPSDSVDTTFLSYIKKLYGEIQGFEIIYSAINDAVTYSTTAGAAGSVSPMTCAMTYATVGGQPVPNLYYLATEAKTSTDQALYAMSVLAPIYGSTNENQYYNDVINAAGTLLGGDPTAIQALISELSGKASDTVYASLLSSVQAALPTAMGGSDDNSYITALATYSTIATTHSRLELICMFAVANGADSADAASIIPSLDAKLPYSENSAYYEFIASKDATALDQLELISNATSEMLTVKGEEYSAYEATAYTPIPSYEGQYFDGWREEVDSVNHTIKNYAEFVEKADPIEEISVAAISTSSVTFTWDEVFGCYGYRVDIYNATTNELMKSDVVRTNSFKMNGLMKGDSIRVVVTVLSMGTNGEYRAESKGYSATSVKDGSPLVLKPSSLDSDPVEISYIHTVEDEIGKVSKAGDYYYITEDEGQKTYIFFTNTTYGFGSRKLEIVSPGAGITDVGKSSTNADAIITGNETGNFIFNIDGVKTMGIVRAMPDTIKSGVNLQHSEAVTVQPDAKNRANFESADFLGASKESYKIGASNTTSVKGSEYNFDDGVNKYSNGIKFDVDNLSTTGKAIKLDRSYKFYKIDGGNRVEVTDTNKLFFYDSANDVFYFKKGVGVDDTSNLGDYEVDIVAKADEGESYVNTFVPKAIKEDSTKMNRLKKTVSFTLTLGVNVYTSEGLRNAMADKNCSSINIQANIHADLATNMYGYMPHLMEIPEIRLDILDWKTGDTKETTKGITEGDADIIEETVIMTTEDGYGPKIFTNVSNSYPAFKDHTGTTQYYYAGEATGTYAIKSAKFTQNFDHGSFKILSRLPYQEYYQNYVAHGYTTAQMFQRIGDNCVPLVVNGNYFDIDASDALYSKSAKKNSVGEVFATYEIQSCHQAIFVTASNTLFTAKNMNVISNSNNVSALLGADSKDVAEIMRFTSGGLSAFIGSDYNSIIDGNYSLESVNVTGALIGIYCDEGATINYCHVKDSWSNGIYAFCDGTNTVSIKNTVVESSGGCATQVDDQMFTAHHGYSTNPTAIIDYTTCTIENFVSGDEQWFKGYSMEVVALGLKSMIDKTVRPMGLTVVQELKNPVSGLTSEYMNWEFFTRTDDICADNYDASEIANHPEDISTSMVFGDDLVDTGLTASQAGIPASGALANARVYSNADGSRVLLMLNVSGEAYQSTPRLDPVGNTQCILVEIVNGEMGNMHLFFRQNQNGLGWIQGMLELFIIPE